MCRDRGLFSSLSRLMFQPVPARSVDMVEESCRRRGASVCHVGYVVGGYLGHRSSNVRTSYIVYIYRQVYTRKRH